ncbi:heterokaryon incompatibility, partial [Glonium stellatum]
MEFRLHDKFDGFVALSYMWGLQKPLMLLSTNLAELEEEGGLSPFDPRIPRTIKDSMILCERLGEDYLWVDSLCIMQKTPEASDQIKRMDSIYQSAKFTIVAAYGTDSEAGLPGVKPGSRVLEQRMADVRGLKLANVLPQFTYTVDNSLWNTRGWT